MVNNEIFIRISFILCDYTLSFIDLNDQNKVLDCNICNIFHWIYFIVNWPILETDFCWNMSRKFSKYFDKKDILIYIKLCKNRFLKEDEIFFYFKLLDSWWRHDDSLLVPSQREILRLLVENYPSEPIFHHTCPFQSIFEEKIQIKVIHIVDEIIVIYLLVNVYNVYTWVIDCFILVIERNHTNTYMIWSINAQIGNWIRKCHWIPISFKQPNIQYSCLKCDVRFWITAIYCICLISWQFSILLSVKFQVTILFVCHNHTFYFVLANADLEQHITKKLKIRLFIMNYLPNIFNTGVKSLLNGQSFILSKNFDL